MEIVVLEIVVQYIDLYFSLCCSRVVVQCCSCFGVDGSW